MKDDSTLKKYLLFFILSAFVIGAAVFYFNISDSKDNKTTIIITPEETATSILTKSSETETTTETEIKTENQKNTKQIKTTTTKAGTKIVKNQTTSITEQEPNYLFIDINSANADDLKNLNGIGDALANEIVNYRETNGRFNNIEEIMNVSGIGEKTFEQIKDNIYVTDPTYPKDDEEEKHIIDPTEPTDSSSILDDEEDVDYPMLPVEDFKEKAPTLEELSPINVNSADLQVLMLLPDIDEATAQNIILFRDNCNGFQSIYELLLVDGITKNNLNVILPYITIG